MRCRKYGRKVQKVMQLGLLVLEELYAKLAADYLLCCNALICSIYTSMLFLVGPFDEECFSAVHLHILRPCS